jgi:hypothetical protein
MYSRRRNEELMNTPIVDEYGVARIAAMMADIKAQCASACVPAASSGR